MNCRRWFYSRWNRGALQADEAFPVPESYLKQALDDKFDEEDNVEVDEIRPMKPAERYNEIRKVTKLTDARLAEFTGEEFELRLLEIRKVAENVLKGRPPCPNEGTDGQPLPTNGDEQELRPVSSITRQICRCIQEA